MIATGIFDFLRSETQRSFGEGSYLFFPATRGSADYTIIVPCTAGTNRGKSRALPGLLSIATDDRVFDVATAGVPFDPETEDCLLFGAPITDTAQSATASAATHRLTMTAHGYVDGDAVRLAATAFPRGLESSKTYYVTESTADDFKLSEFYRGTALTLGSTGTAVTVAKLIPDPDNPPVKYKLSGADNATFHTHWRLTAEKHGG